MRFSAEEDRGSARHHHGGGWAFAPYGSPRASIWPMSCRKRSCKSPLEPSRSNTDAGLPGLVSSAKRGQCPALHSMSFSFSPCATKRGASACDHATTSGTSIAVRPGSADWLSYLLASVPKSEEHTSELQS